MSLGIHIVRWLAILCIEKDHDLTNPSHPDHYAGYFRTAHNDLFQGRIAADFAYNQLKVTSAATIHDGSPYAKSLQQVFADNFKKFGGTITTQEAVNVGDTDFKPVLTKIASGKPVGWLRGRSPVRDLSHR